MKLNYLLLFALIAISFSCRKDPVLTREAQNILPYTSAPVHCYNGFLDGDETDIDCGGSCAECVEITPTCSLAQNTVDIDGTVYNLVYISCVINSDEIEYTANVQGTSMVIEITITNPASKTVEYSFANSEVLLAQDEMYCYLTWPVGGSFYSTASGGTGYISTSSIGTSEITVCETTYSGSAGTKTMSFNFVCP